jgi:transposase
MSAVSDEQKAEVLRLRFVEGLSVRAVATQLAMSRRTVRGLLGERKPTVPRPRALRVSLLAAYDAVIRDALTRTPDLRAPAMLERLRALGYTGGISILREHMRVARPRPTAAVFSTFTTRPGERLEVDWADLGYLLPGVPRRVSAFVALLVHCKPSASGVLAVTPMA